MFRPLVISLLLGVAQAPTVLAATPVEELKASRAHAPRVGEQAPDFELRLLGSSETVRLSELVEERPVALVFGSWT